MRTKNLLSGICAASFVALSLVGCSDYDNGYTEQQISFIQGFKDVFGEIDHTQDWNLAERGNVTVTTSKPSRIKIYAKNFGSYRLVGDYEDVSGTRTLGFDMIEGTTSILVSDGGTSQKTTVGSAVTFAGTRHIFAGDESKEIDGQKIVSVGETEEFEYQYVNAVMKVLPENGNNVDKVTNNFTYISEGEFVIYPIFSRTNSTHILGVYWREGDEIHTQHVYQTTKGGSSTANEYYEPNYDYADAEKKGEVIGGYCKSTGVVINLPAGTPFGFYLEVYTDGSFNHCVYSDGELNEKMCGKTLSGREPTSTGTIQKNGTNGNYTEVDEKNNRIKGDPVFGATFAEDIKDGETILYPHVEFLCFEDWDMDVPDFNDLVFAFKENAPTIIVENAQSWILSCEDLGGAFDLDYNDVVVEVEHIGGRNTATVTPLAAGGTLASYMYFRGAQGLESLGEVHSYFGQGETASGKYTPVNVDAMTPTTALQKAPYRIHVDPNNWSLSTFARKSSNDMNNAMTVVDAKNKTMGGFFVVVLPPDEQGEPQNPENGSYNYPIIQNEVEPTTSNVPYIICTPDTWERPLSTGKSLRGSYRWPQESVAMYKFGDFEGAAYDPTGDFSKYSFYKWVTDRTDEVAKYWYAFPYCDNNGKYSNTCASTAPREINSDTDMDDTGFDYDNLNPKSPNLHIVIENDREGFIVNEYGLSIDLSKSYSFTNQWGNPANGYIITVVSKSAKTPTIKTGDDIISSDGNYSYNGGLWSASITEVDLSNEIWDGYYKWNIIFTISEWNIANTNFTKEVTIVQEASTYYIQEEVSFTTFNNLNGDVPPSEDDEIDLYYRIGKKGGDWRTYASEKLHTGNSGNVDLDVDYSDFILYTDEDLYIEIYKDNNWNTFNNREDIVAKYQNEEYSPSDYTITIPLKGSGRQTIELSADEVTEGDNVYGARNITISFTLQEPDFGNEISKDADMDVTETGNSWGKENTYFIYENVFKQYENEEKVTLTIHVIPNSDGGGGDMTFKINNNEIETYKYSFYNSPNPHIIELSGDNLKNAIDSGLSITCKEGMTVGSIYIKAGSVYTKRRTFSVKRNQMIANKRTYEEIGLQLIK